MPPLLNRESEATSDILTLFHNGHFGFLPPPETSNHRHLIAPQWQSFRSYIRRTLERMFPLSRKQVAAYLNTPHSQATSQAPAPSGEFDMNYYLTEGLGGTEHREFINNSSLAAVVRWQTTVLREGQGAHYLVFSPVTEAQLTEIDGLRLRDTGYERLRFLHLNQEHVLIIKITPAEIHQVATGGFASKLIAKTMGMGMGDELQDMHGTRYQGMASSKEADSAFKPLSFRPGEAGWPTLVIECGVSERVDRLRADAHWWLKSREGSVNIVLLFAISQAKQAIHVEKWEMVSVPSQLATSSNSDPLVTNPTQTDQIDIVHLVPATGALTLKFAQIFLRDPLPGGPEGDIVFSTSDLEQWARDSWASAQ